MAKVAIAINPVAPQGKCVTHIVRHHPVGKEIIKGERVVRPGQDSIKAARAIGRVRHQGARQFRAEALGKIGREEICAAIMRAVARGACPPGGELRIRRGGKVARGAGVGRKARDLLGKFAQALVDPCLLVAVAIPVDHVLELVGQHRLIIVVIARAVEPPQIDVEHLFFVGARPRQTAVLIRAGVIARNAAADARGMEDVQPRVVVHAGVPLAAEEGGDGRVAPAAEAIHRSGNARPIHRLIHFDPGIGHVGLVQQFRSDGKVAVGPHLMHPELQPIAHGIVGEMGIDHLGDITQFGHVTQSQIAQVALGRNHAAQLFHGRQVGEFGGGGWLAGGSGLEQRAAGGFALQIRGRGRGGAGGRVRVEAPVGRAPG